jgi:hypothetical protein
VDDPQLRHDHEHPAQPRVRPLAFLSLGPFYPDKGALIQAASTLTGTLSLFTLLLVSQWWLDRKPKPATAR